ncbi:MAG: GNAT family N-acetyltransferase [Anaerolineales bacterium]|nr:GNAT family N-acetyltransferase [Anaerolineales bacterium]
MILGNQLRFRAIEKEDLPKFVKWLNDPEIKYGLSMVVPLSLAEEENWFENLLKRSSYERPMAIEIQPDPQVNEWIFVGNCGLIQIDWQNRSSEVGIFIGEKGYWNQGFGTNAMRLIIKHGFENLNLHRIWLRVFETNQQAMRSYEKAGFTQEGIYRQAQYLDGKYVDVIIMSMLKSEWQEQQ